MSFATLQHVEDAQHTTLKVAAYEYFMNVESLVTRVIPRSGLHVPRVYLAKLGQFVGCMCCQQQQRQAQFEGTLLLNHLETVSSDS